MDEGKGWLRTYWRTAVALVLIFGLALFLRVYFVYGLAFNPVAPDCTSIYTLPVSGGSDSYYWDRTLCYSFQSGRDLGLDPMLNYPSALQNPRLPLPPWFALLTGRLIAPLFGNPWSAVMFTWLLSAALFGALTVFPTYALAKEAFGRKAGLISALLLAISAGHLQRSVAADARSAALTLFFIVSTFYFFLRALKTTNRRRWVESWFQTRAIRAGFRAFFRENPKSVFYALLAGLCITGTALTWLGWAYVIVILLVWFGAELFLDRFRNEETMGTWILFTLALATPIVLAFQWYYTRAQIRVWFDVPVYLFLAAFVFGLAFTVTRDYPWTLVIPSTLIAGAVGLGIGVFVNPTLANAFFTGAGYFVPTKVVTTIAEEQAPGMSQIILSFGLFTFGLSLLAIGYLLWQIPRRREPAYSLVVIWAFAAIFMALTATRFIFNAAPAFAITAGFAIDQVLVRADFATMRRTYHSLAAGSWRNAVRKSLKPRHVLAVLAIVFLVLLPNVWWAIDASIPFELKSQYDQQVASLLPSFLRAPGYSSGSQGSFYFGAFGYTIPKPTDYYPAAWSWFATQDASTPPELRPAYLSWWDYGFEAVDRGVHPTVADNFQDGIPIAGQFITAQNETAGIALLVIRLLQADYLTHRGNFRPAVAAALESAGVSAAVVGNVFLHANAYVSVVLSDPTTFGLWSPDLQPTNAAYVFLTNLIAGHLTEEGVVSLYHAIRDATGWNIGYFAVDSRLFPISAQNTGIFYAPVKLSDHRVLNLPDGRVLPIDFFQIFANTQNAQNIPLQLVRPGDAVTSQTVVYQPAFYNSMFYRAYVGYAPKDLNSTVTGIPGFTTALQSDPPVPAWNLTHWRVVYRTAYYNPYRDPANHTTAWQAMNYDQAQRKQSQIVAGTIKGVTDLSTQSAVGNGVVFLRYYDGAWVNGTVWSGSQPLPGVRITVTDELGTPHYVTQTDAQGHYSALVPFGNVTITASVGSVARKTLIGSRTLASVQIPVTVDQAMRVPADANGDGVPDWIMTRDLQATPHPARGTVFFDLSRDGAFGTGDLPAPGAAVTLTDPEFAYRRAATSASDGTYSIADLPEGVYRVTVASGGRTMSVASLSITATDATHDISVPFAEVHGFTTSAAGAPVPSADIEFRDETTSTVTPLTSAADGAYVVRPLLSGNYTVTAAAGDLASVPQRIRAENTAILQNLTLLPSGTVAGTTTLFGTAQPFASLDFQSATDPRTIRSTTSDGNAHYSIRLAAGEWFVSGRLYSATGLYATLGTVVVVAGATTPYQAMFVQGVRLTGTVKDVNPAVVNPGATVAFVSPSGQLWLRTDPTGGYLAFLPAGAYDVEAFNQAEAYFASASFSGTARLGITLVGTSEIVGWSIYRDLNRNGTIDPGEAIPGAHVRLTDDRGGRITFTTDGTGAFQIPLFGNRTYSGSVDAAGYAPRTIPASAPIALRTMMPIALTPLSVGVQGSVLLAGAAVLNRPMTVRAVPLGQGAVGATTSTDSNGGYGLGLIPGLYALVVDENVSSTRDSRYQNVGADRIAVAVGQTFLAYDINIVVRTLVRGNVTLGGAGTAASLRFDGPEQRAANATAQGFEAYLVPGKYAVIGNRTVTSTEYVFMANATVPSTTSLTFALLQAIIVTGKALFNGVAVPGPMPVSFVRLEGGSVRTSTDSFGVYTAFLAPGNYSVRLTGTNSATSGGVSRFYRYTFTGNLMVLPGQSVVAFDLLATRTFDNTTVSGTVSRSGIGVDATVSFLARGGGAISAQTAADPSGAYSVSLAPGLYDVYATRATGDAGLLARITIPHAASIAQNLPLVSAFRLSGVTLNPQGAGMPASITIQSGAQLNLTSDARGAYQIVLPTGLYTIAASTTGLENGISVTYRTTVSVALNADMILNLPLAKVVSRSASLTWDTSQEQQIAAGQFVTYTVLVKNTGNVADTFDLSGQPTNWQFSFAPSSVALEFGTVGTASAVQVTIQSPADALVDHGTIQVVATSRDAKTAVGSVVVKVDIQRVRGLGLSLDSTAAIFDGRFLNETLVVKNSGNAAETVTVAITNPSDLAAVGWLANLGATGGSATGATLTGLVVPANATLKVRLQAQSASGASGATVVVQVTAQDSMSVSATAVFTLQLPALASGAPTVSGPDITSTAPFNLQILAAVVGAVGAVGAGLFLTRRRR